MPRPCKLKKVRCLPKTNQFGPINRDSEGIIEMTIEEYETIRLIDYDDYTQIEAAEKMSISKTTIQGLYDSARKKLAKTIVEGVSLHIIGGNYFISKPHYSNCKRFGPIGGNNMIIAITSNDKDINAKISQNLARSKYIMLYNVETKTSDFILNPANEANGGAGVKVAQSIIDNNANVCITLRCGENAYQVLNGKVEVIKAIDDTIQANIDAFLDNKLNQITEVHKGFHENS